MSSLTATYMIKVTPKMLPIALEMRGGITGGTSLQMLSRREVRPLAILFGGLGVANKLEPAVSRRVRESDAKNLKDKPRALVADLVVRGTLSDYTTIGFSTLMGRVGARIPSEGVQVELPKYLDAIRALDGVTAGRLLDKLWNNREELQEILETLSADDLNWVMENWGNRNLDEIWYIVAGSEKILGNLSGENLSLALNRLSIHDSVNLILSSSAKLSDRIASALPALPLEQFTRKLCDEVYGRSSADKFVRSLGKGAAIRLALTLGASSLEELITRVDKDSMDHLAEIYQSEIYGSGRFVQPKSINRLCSLLGPKALAALFMANKGGQLLTGLSNNNLQRLFRQFPDYKLEEWLRTFEYFDRLVSGLTKVELNLVAKALSSSDALEARTRFIQSVGRSNLGSINSNWIARFANEITEQGFHLPLS